MYPEYDRPPQLEALAPFLAEASEACVAALGRLRAQEPEAAEALLGQRSLALFGGRLLPLEEGVRLQLPCDRLEQEPGRLQDVMADAKLAHGQLKEALAPGSSWAQADFDASPAAEGEDGQMSTEQKLQRTLAVGPSGLLAHAVLHDPGIRRRRYVIERAREFKRPHTLQLPVNSVLRISCLRATFDSLEHLNTALQSVLKHFDVVSLHNGFRSPCCLGRLEVRAGIRQWVRDRNGKDMRWHISELKLLHREAPDGGASARSPRPQPSSRRQQRRDALRALSDLDLGDSEAEGQPFRKLLRACGARSADLAVLEGVARRALDCTHFQAACEAAQELERAARLAAEWQAPTDDDERSISATAQAILLEAAEQARLAGVPEAQVQRSLSPWQGHAQA